MAIKGKSQSTMYRSDNGRGWKLPSLRDILSDLPALILCLPLALFAFWAVVAAFTPTAFINRGEWFEAFTLDNFRLALISARFDVLYRNTIVYALGLLAVQLPAAILAAYALTRYQFRLRSTFFYLILFQLFIPPVALIVPNFIILGRLGLTDTLAGIAMPYVASATGIFLLRQGFRQIPRDLDEAAYIDGATPWQVLWYVLLPHVKAHIGAFSIVSIVYHWNEFLWPLVVINSPDKRILSVGLAAFTRSAETGAEWGLIAAGGVLVAAPLIIAFVLFQRLFIESFTLSGVKG